MIPLHAIYSDHIHLPVYESLLVSYWWATGEWMDLAGVVCRRAAAHIYFFVILFKLQLVALAPVSLEAFRVLNGETRAEMTSISRCLSHSTILPFEVRTSKFEESLNLPNFIKNGCAEQNRSCFICCRSLGAYTASIELGDTEWQGRSWTGGNAPITDRSA